MSEKNRDDDSSMSSNVPNIQDSKGNSRLSGFAERTSANSVFYLVAGVSQVLLGLAVITVSVLGLLEPLWLSRIFTMLASATTMIGVYLVYISVSRSRDSKTLIRDAMRRVMKSRN